MQAPSSPVCQVDNQINHQRGKIFTTAYFPSHNLVFSHLIGYSRAPLPSTTATLVNCQSKIFHIKCSKKPNSEAKNTHGALDSNLKLVVQAHLHFWNHLAAPKLTRLVYKGNSQHTRPFHYRKLTQIFTRNW